ncbi:hypothetical protein CPB86DRAFT_479080 [Serendipita vermifera]|nr:hypothetical protein CPB86DRAFT_479080 [Serendipita vermifera]
MPLQYPSPLKTGTQEQLSTNSTTILITAESFIKDRSFSGSTDDVDNYRPQHSASFDNSRVSIPYEERSFSYYAISTFKPLEKINLSSSSNSLSRLLSNNKKSANHVDNSLSEAKHRFQDTSVYDPTDTDPFRHELPISRSTSNPGMSLSCATSNDSCVDTILSSSPDFESPHLLMESYLKWSEKNDPVDSYIPSWPLPRSDSPVSIADEEEIEREMNDKVFETRRKCIVACAEASQKAYPGHPVHEGSVASQFRPFALEEPRESFKTTVFPKCKPLRLKVQAPKSSKYLLGSLPMSRLGTNQQRTYTATQVAGSVPQECEQAPIAPLTPRRHRSEIVDSHSPKVSSLQ